MRKAVVIGASADAIHTIEIAKELGIYVVALDGNPAAEGFKFADKDIVTDISNVNKLFDIIGQIKPDFILPVPVGRLLGVIGKVNDYFKLPGLNFYAAEMSTDKYLFHEVLHNVDLRPISCYLIKDGNYNEDINVSYPAIMKPRFGSGSRNLYLFNNNEEFMQKIDEIKEFDEDYILEDLVDGEEYSLDGAVINGVLEITLLRKKIITPLPVRQAIASISVDKVKYKNLYDKVYQIVSSSIKVLAYDNCLIHVDMIIKDENVFIIEMAPRPSGHSIHSNFVPACTGIDMAREYICYIEGQKYRLSADEIKCQMIRFFDFNGVTVENVPSESDLKASGVCNLIYWNCKIKAGDYLQPVVDGKSLMWRGYFIIEGETEQDLIKQSERILSKFSFRA